MDNDIIDSLNDIGYTGPMIDKNVLTDVIKTGPKDLEFTKLINYLTNELRLLCNIDECVNAITGPEDSISFLLELSSFLKELGCPFSKLTQGHVTDRLATPEDNLLLLDYLLSELMAARMVATNKPEQKMELKIQESPMAKDLKTILLALKFNRPPPNITPGMLFQKVEPKLQETVKLAGAELCGNPIFKGVLTEDQWSKLTAELEKMNADYTIRREMLLKRLDCTIQSFQWSDKIKGKEDQIVQIFYNKRKLLKVNPDIDLSDLLAARDDLAIIEKTSNASVRKNTKSSLNKIIIGQVPDRGGRPSEQAPPPPEMPSWQQRSAGGAGGGRGGRGGGNQNKQGGYSGNNHNQQNNYQDNRGGYQQGSGAYQQPSGEAYQQYSGGGYQQRGAGYQQGGGGYQQGGSYGAGNFNQSGGNYNRGGGGSGRSYESFQHNKTTYADQYVQDSQHNQQYARGGYNSRGQQRGRSNYNRGNYR